MLDDAPSSDESSQDRDTLIDFECRPDAFQPAEPEQFILPGDDGVMPCEVFID